MEDLILSIPGVTRGYILICGILTLGMSTGLLSLIQLYLYMPCVTKYGEWWRLVTNFFVYDTHFSLSWFMNMYFFFQYSSSLEKGSFLGKRSDYIYFLLLGMGQLLGVHALLSHFAKALPHYMAPPLLLGHSLISMIVYVWSMRNRNARIGLWGLIVVSASYFPLILTIITMLFGGNPLSDLIGIAVGHVYYYFEDVYPVLNNSHHIIKTPSFL